MVVTDKIKEELSRNQDIVWYQVRCFNDGMLNSYSRIGVEFIPALYKREYKVILVL